MLSSLDLLYISLALAIIVTTIFINMILYNLYRTLRSLRQSSENALNATNHILNLQRRAKLAILKPIHAIMDYFK